MNSMLLSSQHLAACREGVEEFLNLVKPILPPSAWKEGHEESKKFTDTCKSERSSCRSCSKRSPPSYPMS